MTTGGPTNSNKWAMSSEGRTRSPAPSRWKKEAQLLDRQSAAADYDAVRRAQSDNMARLKALRLAREAADALRPAAELPAPQKARKMRVAAKRR